MRHRTRWITTLILALFLLVGATTSTAQTNSFGPCRALGADISVRLSRGNYEKYFPASSPLVRWASQQERDCMEDARLEAIGQLAYLVGDLAPNAKGDAFDCMTLAYTRILIIKTYRGKAYASPGAEWNHNTFAGRLYQCPGAVLSQFRYDLTNSRTRAAAAYALRDRPEVPNAAALRDVLDVNATFTGPAAFYLYPGPRYDTTNRQDTFMVDTRKHFAPCGGGNGCVDLHKAHAAHACRTLAKCAGTPPSACADPKDGHLVYERGCAPGDEDCQWFRRIAPFDGHQDTETWSEEELCQIAKLEDIAHEEWMIAQERGDAVGSEVANRRHDELHAIENNGQGWEAVFPWNDQKPDRYLIFQGNQTLTPQQLLPLLVAFYRARGRNL